jgi:serine/threonine protein kinase
MRMGGVTEVAEILGVSRQRVARLRERPDFPDPVTVLAQGPIWDLDALEAWTSSGLRRPSGRPTATTSARTLGGRFVLDGPRIGHGGYADVFRALDRKQSGRRVKPVAVKILRDTAQLEPGAVRRFQRELRIMEGIRHRNIVSILAHGETTEGNVWYAMPFAQGNLVDAIAQFPGNDALLLDLIRQLCAGLDHIHGQGVYHRDLKPANILRFEDGTWAISDFGLAVEVNGGTSTLTSTLAGMGSPWYTAPEQWRDARSADRRADIYSLGKVLQTLVTGEMPITDDVPAGRWQPIVQRATATRPDHRYANVGEFLDGLVATIDASDGKQEAAQETVQRLLARVRSRYAAPADLNVLLGWALTLDQTVRDDMSALATLLPVLSDQSIQYLWNADNKRFRTIFARYSSWVETARFDVGHCDALANFSRRAVLETDDLTVLSDAVRSLVPLGHNHNRWHVRYIVITILQDISRAEQAAAAIDAMRRADRKALTWTLSDFSVRSLPAILRNEVDTLLNDSRRR